MVTYIYVTSILKGYDERVVSGKKLLMDECVRVLNKLNQFSVQTWNYATILHELNGPIFQNTVIENMAAGIRLQALKVCQYFIAYPVTQTLK